VSSVLGRCWRPTLLIPTLDFGFGWTSGQRVRRSILISLGIVLMACAPTGARTRSRKEEDTADHVGDERGIYPRSQRLGGLAVAYAPVQFLKLLLGCVLIVAAAKTITSHR